MKKQYLIYYGNEDFNGNAILDIDFAKATLAEVLDKLKKGSDRNEDVLIKFMIELK